MILTDTHTHLYYEEDPEKRRELLLRCEENDVRRLFLPNVDIDSLKLIDVLMNERPGMCFPMVGLHPCSVKSNYEEVLHQLHNELRERKVCAVGEIGIDLYWDKSTLAIQQAAFREQIGWARRNGLPIVIHCREAFDEVFEVLEAEKGDDLRGIFHCFSGSAEQADKVIGLGFFLGIGGVLTYKNSGLDKVVEGIDMKHLVLETDAPYLTPVPFRGKKPNESSFLVYVAQKLAEIKGISLGEVAEITTLNSKTIFGI